MTIYILMKDGSIDTWDKKEYTEYEYMGDIFVVFNGKKWVAIYSMSDVSRIIIG